MKNNIVFKFIKKYRSQFIGAIFGAFIIVNIYCLYQYSNHINRLPFDLYPDLSWDIREPLIEQARAALVLKTRIISTIIFIVSYFPFLMLRFKIDQYESIFNCYRRFKKENTEQQKEE